MGESRGCEMRLGVNLTVPGLARQMAPDRITRDAGYDGKRVLQGDDVEDFVCETHFNVPKVCELATDATGQATFNLPSLGDRLDQGIDGSPIDYAFDINIGLTQVLSNGTNAYLYCASRIGEEQPGGWHYPLGDAMGAATLELAASQSRDAEEALQEIEWIASDYTLHRSLRCYH